MLCIKEDQDSTGTIRSSIVETLGYGDLGERAEPRAVWSKKCKKCSTSDRDARSPLCREAPMRSSWWCIQNLDSSEKTTCRHPCVQLHRWSHHFRHSCLWWSINCSRSHDSSTDNPCCCKRLVILVFQIILFLDSGFVTWLHDPLRPSAVSDWQGAWNTAHRL